MHPLKHGGVVGVSSKTTRCARCVILASWRARIISRKERNGCAKLATKSEFNLRDSRDLRAKYSCRKKKNAKSQRREERKAMGNLIAHVA